MDLHNSTRSNYGLPPLRASAYLDSIARRRSDQMARAQRIWHDYGIGRHVEGDHIIGENVGRGPTVEDIFAAFMDSSSHRANIVRRVYDQVGIAAVLGEDGNVYVTVVFLSPELGRPRNAQRTGAAEQGPPAKDPATHREVSVLLELVRMDSR